MWGRKAGLGKTPPKGPRKVQAPVSCQKGFGEGSGESRRTTLSKSRRQPARCERRKKLKKHERLIMPAKSQAQARMMSMVAHDPKAAKRLGIPQSVGKEFEVKGKGVLKKLPAKVKKKK